MKLAHAKINLGLYVVARRPDGYHDIETVFCRIGIADSITFSESPDIRVTSTSPDAPSDESNICHKAATLLKDRLRVRRGVHIHIEKRVPVGAGLGGGSADAALVLKELPAFWQHRIELDECGELALQLGSDVPYFLRDGAAVGRGRGEQLEYFALDIPYSILLCNPNIHIPTGWAYARMKPGAEGKPGDLKKVVLEGMRNPATLRQLRNDFESVVFEFHPEVRTLKSAMESNGAIFALMSGSGSTVFGFFNDSAAADKLKTKFIEQGYRAFVTPPHFDCGADGQ
jgi:4-diphosphocytidyl-2-C-methyl-D-erythritol kinase